MVEADRSRPQISEAAPQLRVMSGQRCGPPHWTGLADEGTKRYFVQRGCLRSAPIFLLTLDPVFRVRAFCRNCAYREQTPKSLASHLSLAGLPE
jgi:hypothetical protein